MKNALILTVTGIIIFMMTTGHLVAQNTGNEILDSVLAKSKFKKEICPKDINQKVIIFVNDSRDTTSVSENHYIIKYPRFAIPTKEPHLVIRADTTSDSVHIKTIDSADTEVDSIKTGDSVVQFNNNPRLSWTVLHVRQNEWSDTVTVDNRYLSSYLVNDTQKVSVRVIDPNGNMHEYYNYDQKNILIKNFGPGSKLQWFSKEAADVIIKKSKHRKFILF